MSIAVADAAGGAVRALGTMANTIADAHKVLRTLGKAAQVQVTYEAGPTGYGLYRRLVAHGYPAQVIAPSLIPRKAGERIKTDRRDARMLARLARAGELTPITAPDAGDEAIRDRRQRQLPDESLNGANPRISAGFIVETRPDRIALASARRTPSKNSSRQQAKQQALSGSVDDGDHISPD